MTFRSVFAAMAVVFAFTTTASAQEHATLEEAQAMAEAAAAYLEAEGPEIAFPAFTESQEWKDRDLYVFVLDDDGVILANGADASLVGTNQYELSDVNGFAFIQAFIAVETAAWVDYIRPNTAEGQDGPKSTYIIRVGAYIIGVGAYHLAE